VHDGESARTMSAVPEQERPWARMTTLFEKGDAAGELPERTRPALTVSASDLSVVPAQGLCPHGPRAPRRTSPRRRSRGTARAPHRRRASRARRSPSTSRGPPTSGARRRSRPARASSPACPNVRPRATHYIAPTTAGKGAPHRRVYHSKAHNPFCFDLRGMGVPRPALELVVHGLVPFESACALGCANVHDVTRCLRSSRTRAHGVSPAWPGAQGARRRRREDGRATGWARSPQGEAVCVPAVPVLAPD
jgi:hypothetical protein